MSPADRPTAVRAAWTVARVALVAGAAAGVVGAANATSWSADLGAAASTPGRGAVAALSVAEVVCPGPELIGIQGATDTPTTSTLGVAALPPALAARLLGRPATAGALTVGPLGGSAAATGGNPRATVSLTAPKTSAGLVRATGGLAPGLVATQEWTAATKDLRGLVSAPCGTPTDDAWLVAGGGAAGRQERLVLVNPGANVVTADVTLIGRTGPVASPSGTGVVVPARGRTALLLDALSSSETAPVAHVTTRGGLVYAVLNDSWLDGSVPAGSDDTVAAAPPARTVVIPAVPLAGAGILRVGVVGTHEAVVQVRTLSASGGAPLPSNGVATVAGQSVAEFDLSRVPAGTHAIQVTADEPVVAAAVTSRRTGRGPGDFAWSGSTLPVTGLSGSAFPAGGPAPSRMLALVSSGDTAVVEVTTVAGSGAESTQRASVGTDATAGVALPAGVRSVWVRRVEGAGAVRGAVVSTVGSGATQLITTTPLAAAPISGTVTPVVALP